jgi:hypothetical protein
MDIFRIFRQESATNPMNEYSTLIRRAEFVTILLLTEYIKLIGYGLSAEFTDDQDGG